MDTLWFSLAEVPNRIPSGQATLDAVIYTHDMAVTIPETIVR